MGKLAPGEFTKLAFGEGFFDSVTPYVDSATSALGSAGSAAGRGLMSAGRAVADLPGWLQGLMAGAGGTAAASRYGAPVMNALRSAAPGLGAGLRSVATNPYVAVPAAAAAGLEGGTRISPWNQEGTGFLDQAGKLLHGVKDSFTPGSGINPMDILWGKSQAQKNQATGGRSQEQQNAFQMGTGDFGSAGSHSQISPAATAPGPGGTLPKGSVVHPPIPLPGAAPASPASPVGPGPMAAGGPDNFFRVEGGHARLFDPMGKKGPVDLSTQDAANIWKGMGGQQSGGMFDWLKSHNANLDAAKPTQAHGDLTTQVGDWFGGEAKKKIQGALPVATTVTPPSMPGPKTPIA